MRVFTDAYDRSVIGRHCAIDYRNQRDDAAWPWVLAVLPALLGGAAGLAPLSSLISVQPLGETGNPTPAWSLKVHVMLVVVALTATVPVLVLVTVSAGHVTWLSWAAVPAGAATGVALAAYLALAPQDSTGRAGPRRLALRLTILPPGLPPNGTGRRMAAVHE